jgi:hypothetical protein
VRPQAIIDGNFFVVVRKASVEGDSAAVARTHDRDMPVYTRARSMRRIASFLQVEEAVVNLHMAVIVTMAAMLSVRVRVSVQARRLLSGVAVRLAVCPQAVEHEQRSVGPDEHP